MNIMLLKLEYHECSLYHLLFTVLQKTRRPTKVISKRYREIHLPNHQLLTTVLKLWNVLNADSFPWLTWICESVILLYRIVFVKSDVFWPNIEFLLDLWATDTVDFCYFIGMNIICICHYLFALNFKVSRLNGLFKNYLDVNKVRLTQMASWSIWDTQG